jgi:hypothetical protein
MCSSGEFRTLLEQEKVTWNKNNLGALEVRKAIDKISAIIFIYRVIFLHKVFDR